GPAGRAPAGTDADAAKPARRAVRTDPPGAPDPAGRDAADDPTRRPGDRPRPSAADLAIRAAGDESHDRPRRRRRGGGPVRFAHFFIDRPVFAGVLAIVMVIVGGIAAATLPRAQYPEIAPPTVVVTASFPGANSKTVAETVATPIEQQINGVENMLYMS